MSGIKKTAQKKNKVIIIAFIIASLAIIFFAYYYKEKKNKPTSQPYKRYEVPFKKEGELFFIGKINKDTIKKIHIEVAENEQERTQGLMWRYSMADSLGMLFLFEKEKPQSFWMRNTYISLDIIFANEKFEIVTIQKYTQPLSDFPIPSDFPAKYVVETNSGFCDAHKIKVGDVLKFSLD